MTNAVQRGEVLEVVAPSGGFTGGITYVVGELVGVAIKTVLQGELGELYIKGVFTMDKITGALTQGQKVYWDPAGSAVDGSTGAITGTVGSLKQCGWAYSAAASGDASVDVLLGKG